MNKVSDQGRQHYVDEKVQNIIGLSRSGCSIIFPALVKYL